MPQITRSKPKSTTRIPKLRKLLRLMGACDDAQKHFHNMTLSEAWVNFPQDDNHLEEFWKAFFWGELGFGWKACADPTCGVCPTLTRRVKRLTGSHGPATEDTYDLPQWLLDLWDGYEPVKKAAGKKKVKQV